MVRENRVRERMRLIKGRGKKTVNCYLILEPPRSNNSYILRGLFPPQPRFAPFLLDAINDSLKGLPHRLHTVHAFSVFKMFTLVTLFRTATPFSAKISLPL